MNLPNQIKISLLSFIVLTGSLIVFLIYPTLRDIKKDSQSIISQKAALLSLETKMANIEEFKNYLKEITPDLEKIDKLFIDPDLPVDFIGFLEKTAQNSQVFLKISPAIPQKIEKDPWPSIFFQLNIFGSPAQFLKFLEKLESGSYLVEIQNLNIVKLTEAELKSKELERFSSGDLKSTISLKVFTER